MNTERYGVTFELRLMYILYVEQNYMIPFHI